MQKNMFYSALYFIRNKLSPSFSCLLQFLFVSHYQDLFSNTHDHLCSCSYHPEILTCVSSVLLLNVHTWINVRWLSSFFDAWVNYIVCLCFLNENRVKPGEKRGLFALNFFAYKVHHKSLSSFVLDSWINDWGLEEEDEDVLSRAAVAQQLV